MFLQRNKRHIFIKLYFMKQIITIDFILNCLFCTQDVISELHLNRIF